VVCAAIAQLYVDAAYDGIDNRRLCFAEGILPLIRDRGEPYGFRLGTVRCVVAHANAWLLANKCLDCWHDRTSGDRLRPTRQGLRHWRLPAGPGDVLTAA